MEVQGARANDTLPPMAPSALGCLDKRTLGLIPSIEDPKPGGLEG